MAVVDDTRALFAPPGRRSEAVKTAVPPIAIFVAVIALWEAQVIHALLNIKIFQLPLPSQIVAKFGERGRDLWIGTWYTLGEAVVGLLLGAGLGFLFAAL